MWVFIINPAAGNGRAKSIFEKLQRTDIYRSIHATYYFSEYEGHAEEIAAGLLTNVTAVVVIGGDGTVHEVVNGLKSHHIPIGFIPGGSGNDFARGIGLKGNPETLLKQIIADKTPKPYWLGMYNLDDRAPKYFVNSMGFGFDAEVAHRANRATYKQLLNKIGFGTGAYVIALLQVLASFQSKNIEIELDGKKRIIENCWLLSIGNHPYYGGGMKVMPHGEIQPAKFSLFLVHSVSKWKVLALFLTVFAGLHGRIKGVELIEASRLIIRAKQAIHTQVDGQTTTSSQAKVKKRHDKIFVLGTGSRRKSDT